MWDSIYAHTIHLSSSIDIIPYMDWNIEKLTSPIGYTSLSCALWVSTSIFEGNSTKLSQGTFSCWFFFLNVKVHLGFNVVDSICSLFEAMLKKKVLGFRLAFYDNVILIESIMCH